MVSFNKAPSSVLLSDEKSILRIYHAVCYSFMVIQSVPIRLQLQSHGVVAYSTYSGVPRILQMCMHSLFCVCIWRVEMRVGEGGFNPTPQRKIKAKGVYALRFVLTSSYPTDLTAHYL